MQFTVPTSATVTIRKVAITVDGIDSWPLVSIEKVFAYGLQQLLNDAAAPAGAEAPRANIDALIAKRISNLAAGVLRASSTRTGDPVAKEALQIATGRVEAALKKAGREATAAQVRKLATELVATRPEIMETARANVAMVAELEVEVDLGDLGLEGTTRAKPRRGVKPPNKTT